MNRKIAVLLVGALFVLTSFAMIDVSAADGNKDISNSDNGVTIDDYDDDQPASGTNWVWDCDNHVLTINGDVDYIVFVYAQLSESNDSMWSEGVTIQINGNCTIGNFGIGGIEIAEFVPEVKITGGSLTITGDDYASAIRYDGSGDLIIEDLESLNISGFGGKAIFCDYASSIAIRNCEKITFEDAESGTNACICANNGIVEIKNSFIVVKDYFNCQLFAHANGGFDMEEPKNAKFGDGQFIVDNWDDNVIDILFDTEAPEWTYGSYSANVDYAPIAIGIFIVLLAVVVVGAYAFSKK